MISRETQLKVLQRLGCGFSYREIARELGVSDTYVKELNKRSVLDPKISELLKEARQPVVHPCPYNGTVREWRDRQNDKRAAAARA